MNEHDPLEAELAALQPRDPSPQLRQRIAEQLTVARPRQDHSNSCQIWWNGAIAGGLIAACLVTGLLLLRPTSRNNEEGELTAVRPQLDIFAVFDNALPTVWSYQRALAHSPQDLEALLEKHAAVSPSHVDAAPRHLFIHSDAQFLFQGDL